MDDDWKPVATYGDTEAQVRARYEQMDAAALPDLRRQLAEAGMPEQMLPAAMMKWWAWRVAYWDKTIPQMLRDMKATAAPSMRRLRIVPKD